MQLSEYPAGPVDSSATCVIVHAMTPCLSAARNFKDGFLGGCRQSGGTSPSLIVSVLFLRIAASRRAAPERVRVSLTPAPLAWRRS
jgi:hypothetical protein